MRFRYLLASVSSSLLLAAAFSCAGAEEDDPSATPQSDAASEIGLLPDAAPPDFQDAEPPPGNVCGDRSGLQLGSSWPLRGGCPTRAGYSQQSGPQSSDTFWNFTDPAGETSPAIAGGTGIVWVGTAKGDVLAITAAGVGRWAFRTTAGTPIRSSAAMDLDGTAIVAADGKLYGLTKGEGQLNDADAGVVEPDSGLSYPPAAKEFELAIGATGASSPVIGKDGTIYVGTSDGKLHAVAPKGTSIKWSATTNDTGGSSPAIGQDETIYVGSTDHKLYAITTTGAIKWALDLGAEINGASPAVGGEGSIYIGTMDGKLHAVKPEGTERWSYPTAGAITGTPAVYAGAVYVGSEDKFLHAVSVVDGQKRWVYETLGAVATPVIGPDGVVYVGATDSRVYALSSKGSLVFAVNVKGKVRGAPAITSGPTLFITTDNGVTAVGP